MRHLSHALHPRLGAVGCVLAGLILLAGPATAAPGHDHDHAARANFDARLSLQKAQVEIGPSAVQVGAMQSLSASVDDLAVDFDPMTGAARSLRSHTDLLTPFRADANVDAVAHGYLRAQLPLLGLTAGDLDSMRLADRVYSKVSGATHFHFRQTFAGLDVYGSDLRISVNRDGRVISVNSNFVPDFAAVAEKLSPAPVLGADTVVSRAASFLGISTSEPPVAVPTKARRAGVRSFVQAELSNRAIDADLQWLPVSRDQARLVWRFTLDRSHLGEGEEMTVDAVDGKVWTRFNRVFDAQYRAYAPPVESPLFTTPLPPSDGRSLWIDPQDVTASPLGWHDDGSSTYTTLRGNNAQVGNHTFDCGASLDCDAPLAPSGDPSLYKNASATNAFVWANYFHDVTYKYGFDEAAGNYQVSNFGNGGSGGDPVNIDIQIGSVCNASFNDTVDGSQGQLNLYVCSGRDGALDNGVILHELGHGANRRQVGGPSLSCLNNVQDPDEGWADFFGLALTAETGDAGTDARSFGTWLIGSHIRSQLFSTDPAVNTMSYADLNGASVPYGVGEIWTQVLWEMFWALNGVHGFDADWSAGPAGGAGNQRALFYVMEGQRLTPCNPTLLDTRDAVIQAAADNFSGADLCTVWQVFADYGMGVDATNGGSNTTSGTSGFALPAACGGTGNTPPSVTLLQPANGSSYTVGDSVSFSGSASDAEDGNLTPSLAWTSSLDGSLGTGGSFSSTGLSVGTHTITASVTDSGGVSGSDSVTITVNGACLPLGATCASRSDCCSNRCRGKNGAKTCR